jgi:hypothetical protein
LEAATFPDEKILEVLINEENFDGSIKKTAFDDCMTVMRSANIIIILYNGEAGWSIAGDNTTNGICHEEFLIATSNFRDMSFMVDLSHLFEPADNPAEQKKNDQFQKDVRDSFPPMPGVRAKNIDELKAAVLSQGKRYVLKALQGPPKIHRHSKSNRLRFQRLR